MQARVASYMSTGFLMLCTWISRGVRKFFSAVCLSAFLDMLPSSLSNMSEDVACRTQGKRWFRGPVFACSWTG